MIRSNIIILGAGVIGCATAWHLAKKGAKSILVLEREKGLGLGTTGKATGGYRAQFGTEINVRLSLLSRRQLLAFKDDTGVDPGYLPAGYIFLATEPSHLAELRTGIAMQRRNGLAEVREVSPKDIAELNPAVALDGILGGSFCPTDGFVKPLEILRGCYEAAQRQGVTFELDCGPARPLLSGVPPHRRVLSIETSKGRFEADTFVNCTGPWAGVVGAASGLSIPVWPMRRQVALTHPFPDLPTTMPLTIDCGDGFHTRVRDDGRVLLLKPTETHHADPFDITFDSGAWLDGLLQSAHRRIPCLARATLDPSLHRAGLYEMSPDKHALLGRAPGCQNLYLANGNSGHGVMHSLAEALLLSELILDGHSHTLDIHPLRPTRFAEGDPLPTVGVI